jgi:hypothetical protein
MRAVPTSGASRVARIRTSVVLPAPLRPRRPSTVPRSTSRSTPARATVEPKDFTSVSAVIIGVSVMGILVR